MNDDHRAVRELLGSFALGHLTEDEAGAVGAHLDGCADCRGELAEIEPLRLELGRVGSSRLQGRPSPPPDLGERIWAAVAAERQLVQARTAKQERRTARTGARRRVLTAAAALAVATAGVGVGFALDRETRLPVPRVPIEALVLQPAGSGAPTVDEAGLVSHAWGVEVRFTGSGFAVGQVFRAAFLTTDGSLQPAGEFLGTGPKPLKCNLQAALLRDDTAGFVVMDAAGGQVLQTDL